MEKQHREAIQKNFVALVQQTNLDLLIPELVRRKVFSPEMIIKYTTAPNHHQRKRDLFLDIQRRGPRAFANLVSSLCDTHQVSLANLLQPLANNNTGEPRRHATPFLLPTNEDIPALDPQEIQQFGEHHNGNINLRTTPLKINVIPAKTIMDDPTKHAELVYSTHSKNRGIVLMINNIRYVLGDHVERRGAEVDERNLKDLFYQMGFRVECHIDLTAEEMRKVIFDFKSSEKLRGVDMVFIIIMGHGHQNPDLIATDIIGIDDKSVTTTWIEEQLDNLHCKMLQKIPKIIMYQTCRGDTNDYGVALRTERDSSANVTLRTKSDMLVSHSTIPGKVSHRDIYLGTWYINLFCEVMMNEAHRSHIETIFKILDAKLDKLRSRDSTMQTSMFTNIGFKTCFVHPTIYMEDGEIKQLPLIPPE